MQKTFEAYQLESQPVIVFADGCGMAHCSGGKRMGPNLGHVFRQQSKPTGKRAGRIDMD